MSAALRAALDRARVPYLAGEPLARHTTLGVGGPVPVLLEPRTAGELLAGLDALAGARMPWRVLGAGSNLLAADRGLDFAVVATARLARDPRFDGTRVEADAGLALPRLVRATAERGLEGLEFGIGVPGSVGGALRMNAGCWGSDMSRVVEAVWVARPGAAGAEEAPFEPAFAYRRAGVDASTVVTRVAFRLAPGDAARSLATIERYLTERRRSQPTAARSAGCAFRNPPGDAAGRLIDQAGLKGLSRGAAQVSHLHANFVLNRGGASAADVYRLIEEVRERVEEHHGIRLEREIEVWGDP